MKSTYATQRLAEVRAQAAAQAAIDAERVQRYVKGEEHGRAKLTARQVEMARKIREQDRFSWADIKALLRLDVSTQTLRNAGIGKTWRSV